MAATTTEAKPRMFVVDDDMTWCTLLKTKFGKRFDVTTYTKGEAAIEALHLKPEIIILDYHLNEDTKPEFQLGMNVLKEIRKSMPTVPVVMLSAQEDVQVAVDVLNSGAYDYVKKSETAAERLNIIIRNIQNSRELKQEVVELKLSIQRSKLAVIGLTTFILLLAFFIYLKQCPSQRLISWDPFGVANDPHCMAGVVNPIN